MTIEKQSKALTMAGIMPQLVRRYLELAESCYRVSVSHHDERGRFRKGHRGRRIHPALLKKVDLDHALERVYERFFGQAEPDGPSSNSISNSRFHGREALISTGEEAVTLPSSKAA